MFVIEDEVHTEWLAPRFDTRDEALAELRRIASVPWMTPPNRPPCSFAASCRRSYELVEYDTSVGPTWRELTREPVLEVSAEGVRWLGVP